MPTKTAADLVSRPIECLSSKTTFQDAIAFLIDNNLTVSPVLNAASKPIGVLSATDLLIHIRENGGPDAPIESMMTPAIFTVSPKASIRQITSDILRSNVHHLFVTEDDGRILGVISVRDLLRHLQ